MPEAHGLGLNCMHAMQVLTLPTLLTLARVAAIPVLFAGPRTTQASAPLLQRAMQAA